MNKIKVLHDVFKTMKDKEVFKGNLMLEAVKGEEKLLSLSNEFETNTKNGETKVKLNVDLDSEGKKVKHESNSEFNIKSCPHHKFHRGMHMQHHGHHHGCGGIKAGLSKITLVLNLLSNMQVEEKEGNSIISLDLKEILKEMKDMHKDVHKDVEDEKILEFHKQMHAGMNKDFCKHHKFIKEILCSEKSDSSLKIYANKNNEIEKIEISAKGENSINGTLDLVW